MKIFASRRECLIAVCLALCVLLLTGIPYLVGWANATPERVFEGFVIDVEDAHSHLAKMEQGRQGSWEYKILFTPEPHSGEFINVFYLGLGHLAGALGLDSVLVYHLARLLFGFAYLMAAFGFAGFFIADHGQRVLAYVLISFSSGLGWLALLLSGSFVVGNITPVDFWFIEMYTFFTVMIFPHTSLALALMLVALALFVRFTESGNWILVLGAVATALVIALIHAYTLLVIDLCLAAFWLLTALRQRALRLRTLAGLSVMVLVPLPLVAHQYLSVAGNPVLAGWQAQSTTFSPAPWHYILGYGIVLLLALPGGWWALGQARRWPLLPLWLLIIIPLLYAPVVFNLQRRMIEGAHVPLCILAVVGMTRYMLPGVERSRLASALAARGYPAWRLKLLARNLLVALTLPSTLFLIVGASLAAAASQPDMVYSRTEVEAVEWLGANSQPEDTVLASYQLGGYIPAHTGHRVYAGHWAETLDVESRKLEIEQFFGTTGEEQRRALLKQHGIVFVFYGPRERAMGSFQPAETQYLVNVFEEEDVTIYHVRFSD